MIEIRVETKPRRDVHLSAKVESSFVFGITPLSETCRMLSGKTWGVGGIDEGKTCVRRKGQNLTNDSGAGTIAGTGSFTKERYLRKPRSKPAKVHFRIDADHAC